uniref:Transposase, mutator type n=1 Tax=Tanacetum cinerariifolium TaxID=118510 RepID=A0A6L2L5Z8_TANCI|nr:transposase, mutator type [Tanacetum cinerariifolium]
MSNASAFGSNRRGNAKTAQLWTTAEEITLCTACFNAMDTYGTKDSMKRGFWSEVFANFEKEIRGLFENTIPSSSNGNIQFVQKLLSLVSFTIVPNGWTRARGSSSQQHTQQPMYPISLFLAIEESADEHEIGDEYLTEKDQSQLLLDEDALRETLKEEAMAEKEWDERIKKEQAHDELVKLKFGVKFDCEY